MDEVAHHADIPGGVAGVYSSSVRQRLVLENAVLSVRKHGGYYRVSFGSKRLETPCSLGTRRINIIFAKDPELRCVEVAQHRHRVIVGLDSRKELRSFFTQLIV